MKPTTDIHNGPEIQLHDRRLIYFSSVPYASYAQRPHFMAKAFLDGGFDSMLWIDPYPTRLPSFADLKRIRHKSMPSMHADEARIAVLQPLALPIEPLPMSGRLNRIFAWRPLLEKLREFALGTHHCVLGIGRPSRLSEWALEHIPHERSFIDVLDNFPAFYRGLSRISMKARLHAICRKVSDVYCSSSQLTAQIHAVRPDAITVFNGYPTNRLPQPSPKGSRRYIGYVGTIGEWFDWPLVRALALSLPNVPIWLIGPEFVTRPTNLPANIEFCGEQPQTVIAELIRNFTVGLIPFRINDLTAGVDPIKFYEYRSMGIPVWSTVFGEMCLRGNREGVTHISSKTNWRSLWECAQATTFCLKDIASFRIDVAWNKRFEPMLQRSQARAVQTHGETVLLDRHAPTCKVQRLR